MLETSGQWFLMKLAHDDPRKAIMESCFSLSQTTIVIKLKLLFYATMSYLISMHQEGTLHSQEHQEGCDNIQIFLANSKYILFHLFQLIERLERLNRTLIVIKPFLCFFLF
ncbi:hypothetical protein S83_001628 [Arachis hypogaea]